jgi:hypothetical protein
MPPVSQTGKQKGDVQVMGAELTWLHDGFMQMLLDL